MYPVALQGIRGHCVVLLEVDWSKIWCGSQVENLVLVYHKTYGLGSQTFQWDKFARWAANGSCVEEIWINFKEKVFECIECLLHTNSEQNLHILITVTGRCNDLR
jgi:hypothetical protein